MNYNFLTKWKYNDLIKVTPERTVQMGGCYLGGDPGKHGKEMED